MRDFDEKSLYLQKFIRNYCKNKEPSSTDLSLTGKTEKNFRESGIYWFCEFPLDDDEKEGINDKVRDHCFITGFYMWGAANAHCILNVNKNSSSCVPIVVNNMTYYDHLYLSKN